MSHSGDLKKVRKDIKALETAENSPEFRARLVKILYSIVNILQLSDSGDVDLAHWQEMGREIVGADSAGKQSLSDVLKTLSSKTAK